MNPPKSKFSSFLNKAQDFVLSPEVKRVAEVGGKVLDVASKIGQAHLSGPLGVLGAVVGTLDVVTNSNDDEFYAQMARVERKLKLECIRRSGIIPLLFEQGLFKDAEILAKMENDVFKLLRFGEGKGVAVVATKNGKLQQDYEFYVLPGTRTRDLSELLWGHLGCKVMLAAKNDGAITVAGVEGYQRNEYAGENSPEALVEKFKRYQQAGISRAYLAIGPPGTGKSTFCFKVADLVGGRILVITPDVLSGSRVPHSEIISLVGTFKPDVLVFDDIDRVADSGLLLSLIDYARKRSPTTLVISTANRRGRIVEALRRPGRLGAEIIFSAPDDGWRETVIKLYSEKFKIPRDITHLSAEMIHPKFTQDYIKEVCEQALVEDDAALQEYIRRTIENFEEDDEE